MATGNKMTVMNLADWAKVDVDEIRERWAKRRRELEEIEKKKTKKEKRIEEAKKRKRVIRERRCFVCGIFGHMAFYCRNREEKKGPAQVSLNKFEVLKDRVMEKGEGSGRKIVKDRREILKEERVKETKKEKKIKVQKKDLGEKKEKKVDNKTEEKKMKEEKREEKIKIEM